MKSQRKELPTVEKGIPLPVVKYHPKTRASRSRWVDFLLALEPGDSFVIQKGETQTVMIQAKRLDMFITWRTCPEGLRVWLVPEEKIPAKPKMKWLPLEKRQVPHPEPQPPAPPPPPSSPPPEPEAQEPPPRFKPFDPIEDVTLL